MVRCCHDKPVGVVSMVSYWSCLNAQSCYPKLVLESCECRNLHDHGSLAQNFNLECGSSELSYLVQKITENPISYGRGRISIFWAQISIFESGIFHFVSTEFRFVQYAEFAFWVWASFHLLTADFWKVWHAFCTHHAHRLFRVSSSALSHTLGMVDQVRLGIMWSTSEKTDVIYIPGNLTLCT